MEFQIMVEISCLNFWDEACWFLSLMFFGLLSSSLLLFPQHFGWYVLQPSSGVCRTREPSNFHEGSRVRQTPEEGRRTYQPKCCGNNNKDEDNSPKNLIDKNMVEIFIISLLELEIYCKGRFQKPSLLTNWIFFC